MGSGARENFTITGVRGLSSRRRWTRSGGGRDASTTPGGSLHDLPGYALHDMGRECGLAKGPVLLPAGRLLLSSLREIVLHDAYFYAGAAHALSGGVAQAENVHAVGRDLLVLHQVTDDRVRHFLGVGHGGLAVAGREALNFKDVAVLTLELCGDLVEGVLGLFAQGGLAGTEMEFGLRSGFVLIEVADYCFGGGDASVESGDGLMGRLSLAGGVGGVLMGQADFFRGQVEAVLGAGIDDADHFLVGGGDLV